MRNQLSFKALLEPDDGTSDTAVIIPFNVHEAFGTKARVPVRGTINGYPFRSSIFPIGGRFLLVVDRSLRQSARVCAGDLVDVDLERDTEPRTDEPPMDLAEALRAFPSAQAAWDKQSYTHRKEFILAIAEARRPETRTRMVRKAIEELLAKKQ